MDLKIRKEDKDSQKRYMTVGIVISVLLLFAICLPFANILFQGQKVDAEAVTHRKINHQKVSENIKTCSPYSETANYDYMGMDINFTIKILGWQNGKCRVDFTSKLGGATSSFAQMYGVDFDDAIVTSYMPQARCAFTKEQLAYVGDSILEEGKRSAGGSMLKNPNSIQIPETFSGSDLALLDVIFRQNACTIN